MRRAFLVPSGLLLLLFACGGGAGPASSAPCAPCQSTAAPATSGLQGVGLPRSEKLDKLAARRVELAQKRLVKVRVAFDHGRAGIDDVFAACRDVAFAARDSGMHGESLRGVVKEYRDAVLALRDLTRERIDKGAVTEDEMTRVEALVAEAEFWLEEANTGM
jgi:hypothetical protein